MGGAREATFDGTCGNIIEIYEELCPGKSTQVLLVAAYREFPGFQSLASLRIAVETCKFGHE